MWHLLAAVFKETVGGKHCQHGTESLFLTTCWAVRVASWLVQSHLQPVSSAIVLHHCMGCLHHVHGYIINDFIHHFYPRVPTQSPLLIMALLNLQASPHCDLQSVMQLLRPCWWQCCCNAVLPPRHTSIRWPQCSNVVPACVSKGTVWLVHPCIV